MNGVASESEHGVDTELDTEPEQDRLYSLLNVDKEASTEDVIRAYKGLALVLHPDKQPPALREKARKIFGQIQFAHTVLSDPHQRAVYDLLGEDALKLEWRVSTNGNSPAELRAQWDAFRARGSTKEASTTAQPQSDIVCVLDGRALVARKINGRSPAVLDRLSHVHRRLFQINQSLILIDTSATRATIRASLQQRSLQSSSEVRAYLRQQISPRLVTELHVSIFEQKETQIQTTYALHKSSFVRLNMSSRPIGASPVLDMTYGQNFTSVALAYATCTFGTLRIGLLPLGLAPRGDVAAPRFVLGGSLANSWSGHVQSSAQGLDVHLERYSFNWAGARFHVRANATSRGHLGLAVGGERGIVGASKLGIEVSHPVIGSGALLLRLRVSRPGQRIEVPIALTRSPSWNLALACIAIPSVSMCALHYLYLLPRKRRKIERKLAKLRDDHWQTLERHRLEALDAGLLLREALDRRSAAEGRLVEGLVITLALYRPVSHSQAPAADVTVPVQALVNNNVLIIPGGRSKSRLIGFYDVCAGEPKELLVRYIFRGTEHEALYDDLAGVTAPLRSHAAPSL